LGLKGIIVVGMLIQSAIVGLHGAHASQDVLSDGALAEGGAESGGRLFFGGYTAAFGEHQAILLDSWEAVAGFLHDVGWESDLGEKGREDMRRELDFSREVLVVVTANGADRCEKIRVKSIDRVEGDQLVLHVEEYGTPQCTERHRRAQTPQNKYILVGVRVPRPAAGIAEAKFQRVAYPYPEPGR
jgi:hypothetical protein